MVVKALQRLSRGALDLLYPPRCLLCGTTLTDQQRHVCDACRQALPLIRGPRCPRCFRPVQTRNGQSQVCGACRLHPRGPLSRIAAAGEYRAGLRELIHLYKYSRYQFLADELGTLLLEQGRAAGIFDGVNRVVPIPLHWTRARWRGFNQARELARRCALQTGLELLPAGDFVRRRKTTPQVRLNAAGRAENMRGAFAVRRPARIEGACLLLVDDVLTTGATAHECARALRRAGAAEVRTLVIGR
jgi:ComF family protein